MRLFLLSSAIAVTVATAIACGQDTGDPGRSAAADTSSDAGAPDTPITAAEKKLIGVWSKPGSNGTGPIGLVVTSFIEGRLSFDRDTPHVPQPSDPPDTGDRDRSDSEGRVVTVDSAASGTLVLSQFVFDIPGVDHKIAHCRYTFGSANGAETLTLVETDVAFVKDPPFDSDAGITDVDVDAGALGQLEPPITYTRATSFCGFGGDSDCADEFFDGVYQPKMPAACKDREDLCLFCNPSHECRVQVPSTCELARFTCVESDDVCEFANRGKGTTGEVTTVDTAGQAVSCDGSPSGSTHAVCCEGLKGDDDDN